MEISVKQNDTARTLTDTLTIDNVPVDLTDSTVKSIFKRGTLLVEVIALITGLPTAGTVQCVIPETVISSPGKWHHEWEVTYFLSGKQLTVPTMGYNLIQVNPDLNTTT